MTKDPADLDMDRPRLELALGAARLGDYEWDMAADVFRVNARTAAITGWPVGPFPTQGEDPLLALVHPDDRKQTQIEVLAAITATGRYNAEHRIVRPDNGQIIWVRAAGVLIRNEAGTPIAVCGILRDITERRLVEDQRQTLMAELDHRVKNVLATVQALAQQTAKRTRSLGGFLTAFSGRLKSMASANELLTAARWRGAAIAHLAAAELGGIAPGQTTWEGPEIFLTPRSANALALALHELATNALKFGALSTEAGRVALRWSKQEVGGFQLWWIESGGPAVKPPAHLGFGSTLLRQVTGRELNGAVSVEYRAAGLQAHLTAGAAAVVERPESIPDAPRPQTVDPAPQALLGGDLKGSRVLIVEDAVLLALELETGLSQAGAEIIGPAYELEEAMALLDQHIDAAVLDANLNGRSISPVAQILAARGVPFVFATGYGDAGGAPSGFDAPIIRKPYDVSQIAAALRGLLGR